MNPGSSSRPSLVLTLLSLYWLADETLTQDWFGAYPSFYSDFGVYATQAPAPPWGHQYSIPQNIGILDPQAGTMNVQQGPMEYQQAELINTPGATNHHQTQTKMGNVQSQQGPFHHKSHSRILNGPDQSGGILQTQPGLMSGASIVDSQNPDNIAHQHGSVVPRPQNVPDATASQQLDVNSQVGTGQQTGKLEAPSVYSSQWQGELLSNQRSGNNGSSRAEVGSPASRVADVQADHGAGIFSGNTASSGQEVPNPQTVPGQWTGDLPPADQQTPITDNNAWHHGGGKASVGSVQSVAFPQQNSWQPSLQDQQVHQQHMHTNLNGFVQQSDPRTFQTMLANNQNQQPQQNSSMNQFDQQRVIPNQHIIPWGMIRPSAYPQLQAMDPTARANWIYQMQMKARQYYRQRQMYPTQTWNTPAGYATIPPAGSGNSAGPHWASTTSSTTKQQPNTQQHIPEKQLQPANGSSIFQNMMPTPPTRTTPGQQTTPDISTATMTNVTSSSTNTASEGNQSLSEANMTIAELQKIVRVLLIPHRVDQLMRVTTQAPTLTVSIPVSRLGTSQGQRPISEMFIRMINFAPRPLWISAPTDNNRHHKQPMSEIHVKLVNYDQRIVDSFNGHISSPNARPSRNEESPPSTKRGHRIPGITFIKSSADIPDSSVPIHSVSSASNNSTSQGNVQNHQQAVVRHTQMLHHVMNSLQKELNRFQGSVRQNRDPSVTDRSVKEVKPSRSSVAGTTESVPPTQRNQPGFKPTRHITKEVKAGTTGVSQVNDPSSLSSSLHAHTGSNLQKEMPLKDILRESTSIKIPLVTSTPSTTTSRLAASSHMTTIVPPALTKPDTVTRTANSSDFRLKDIPAAIITGDPGAKRNKLSELLEKSKSSYSVPLPELPNVELTALYPVHSDVTDGNFLKTDKTVQKTLSSKEEPTTVAPSSAPTTTVHEKESTTQTVTNTAEMRKQQINDQINEQLSVLNRLHQRQKIIDHQHQLREQHTRLQKQRDILQQQLQALQQLRDRNMGINKSSLPLPAGPEGIANAWEGIQMSLLEAGFR
ncbi:transcription initiation factor TFIID subunit 12-like [Haliotis asinina]|uniref:transcription initiation factor TFIID subunit 12-like n=1 Tax=Haliotis asinina TaxID=109174 RepID=UPI003531D0D8